MKNITFIILCLITISSVAQQPSWQPFPFGQVTYYSDSSIFPPSPLRQYFTLSADSFLIEGNDTTVYFNRKLIPGESLCTQPGSSLWNGLDDYSAFQRSTIRVAGDTVWFDNSSVAWIFNRSLFQPLNLSPHCDSIVYMYSSTWFDSELQDSIRSISAYNSDDSLLFAENVMRISKTHGFIKMTVDYDSLKICHQSPIALTLRGYKNDSTQWGFEPPPIERYFRFYEGDIIKQHYSVYFPQTGDPYTTRDSVISVSHNGDIVTVQVHRVKTVYEFGNGTIDTTYVNDITFSYDLADHRTVFMRTSGMGAIGYLDSTSGVGIRLYSDSNSCGLDTIIEIGWGGLHFNADSCDLTELVISSGTLDIYSTRRGFLFSGITDAPYNNLAQVGYYSPLQGIACGDWLPVGVIENIGLEKLEIYPNPTEDKITLTFHQPVSGTIFIYDNIGKLQMHHELQHNALVELNVNDLASELYVVKVLSENGVITSKFVKH
jgi:hypothetical protein